MRRAGLRDPTEPVRSCCRGRPGRPRSRRRPRAADVTHTRAAVRGARGGPRKPRRARAENGLPRGHSTFTAHHQTDAAETRRPDALAAAIGLDVQGPLVPAPGPELDKIITFIPVGPAISTVRDALSAAGAGRIGDYSDCSFATAGTGQFKPLTGANPTIGDVGRLERVAETKLEMILPRTRRAAVWRAAGAHPYESRHSTVRAGRAAIAAGPAGSGPARTERWPRSERVAAGLQSTSWGCARPRPERRSGKWPSARAGTTRWTGRGAGVDAYVTADLRHHPASEHLLAGSLPARATPALVDVAHWASEWPWCQQAADVVDAALGGSVEVRVSRRRTDPWTVAPSAGRTQ